MSDYLRNILKEIPAYIPGRTEESIRKQYGLSKIIKLASNENPVGPSPKALKAVKEHIRYINRYPDPDGASLKSKLAEKFGLSPDNFLLSNGAAELIDLAAMAFINPGDKIIQSYPTFPKYLLSSKRMMGNVISIPMKNYRHDYLNITNAMTSDAKLVFIDTPCNPVGTKLEKHEQEYIAGRLPEKAVLVIDEAYRYFVDETECLNYDEVVSQRKNILFLRTFSKDYGLAGLRIGYAVGHPDLISDINRVREVFNTNSLALVAAEAALDDAEHLLNTLEVNRKGKYYLYCSLINLGFEFRTSFANFILINTKRNLEVVDSFMLKHGIIIRPINLKELGNGHIRVSIGTMPQNRAFIKVLKQLKEEVPEN